MADVFAPSLVTIDSILVTPPSCPGENTGTAIVFASGGTEPYNYGWSTTLGSIGSPILTAGAGTYDVSLTDANFCPTVDTTFTIPEPRSIVVTIDTTRRVSCFGATGTNCNGQATATAMYSDGTTGTFDFEWVGSGESDTGVSSSTANLLCAGNQQLVVTDGNCVVTPGFTINSNAPLTTESEITPVSCFGLSDGLIEIEATGGEGPYTFNCTNLPTGATIPPATANPQTVSGIPADTFFVDIIDNNGCMFSSSVIVTEPDEFIAFIDSTNTFDVECPGGDNGQVAVLFQGGNNTGNITYDWTPNVAPRSSPGAFDLTAGTYSVVVTDNAGCESTVTRIISEPPPITFTLEPIPPIQCFGFTTALNIGTVSGGNGGSYAYSIDGAPLQDISFGTNVFAGPHIIDIFDSRNCSIDTTISITQPNPVVINIDPVIEVELGDSLRLMPQFNPGGLMIDSVIWTPGDQLSCDDCLDPIVRPLEDQSYLITAFDTNGCEGDAEVFIEVDRNRNVFVPNAFSPNGDGINDEFRVFTGVGVQNVNFVRVFDRWGNLVFEQTNLEPDVSGIPTWDGFFKGRPMDPQAFVYLVEVAFEDDVTLLFRGSITLMR